MLHELHEPAALFVAQTIAHRRATIREEQLRGVGRLQAHLFEVATAFEAGAVFGFHHDERDTFAAKAGIGFGDHDHQIRVLPVGDVGFGAVDHVVVAVAQGRGAHCLQVGAGVRFGHGDGAHHLAAGHFRQPTLLLLLGPVVEYVGRNDGAVHLIPEPGDPGGELAPP